MCCLIDVEEIQLDSCCKMSGNFQTFARMELARAPKVTVWTLPSVVALMAVAGMDVGANEPIICNRNLYELVQALFHFLAVILE